MIGVLRLARSEDGVGIVSRSAKALEAETAPPTSADLDLTQVRNCEGWAVVARASNASSCTNFSCGALADVDLRKQAAVATPVIATVIPTAAAPPAAASTGPSPASEAPDLQRSCSPSPEPPVRAADISRVGLTLNCTPDKAMSDQQSGRNRKRALDEE